MLKYNSKISCFCLWKWLRCRSQGTILSCFLPIFLSDTMHKCVPLIPQHTCDYGCPLRVLEFGSSSGNYYSLWKSRMQTLHKIIIFKSVKLCKNYFGSHATSLNLKMFCAKPDRNQISYRRFSYIFCPSIQISVSPYCKYYDYLPVACGAMQSGRLIPTLQRKLLIPSSR
jgi:hypothetical protein